MQPRAAAPCSAGRPSGSPGSDRSGREWRPGGRSARGGRTRVGRCPRGPTRPARAGFRARPLRGPDVLRRPAPEPGPPLLSSFESFERARTAIIGSPRDAQQGPPTATVQNAAKTGTRLAAPGAAPESAVVHALYCRALGTSSRGSPDEADLSAEEAQASPDSRFPRAQPYALGSRDPEAPASEGPQAPHSVALGSEGRPDARRRRLSRSGDFDRLYREGSSRGNRFLVLYSFTRGEGPADGSRLGLSVGRKIGKAVTRNKVKRAIREAFWELSDRLAHGDDYVVVARTGIETLLEREGQKGVRSSLAELVQTQAEPEGEERLS